MSTWFYCLRGLSKVLAKLVAGDGCRALVYAALEVRVVGIWVNLKAGASFGGTHVQNDHVELCEATSYAVPIQLFGNLFSG